MDSEIKEIVLAFASLLKESEKRAEKCESLMEKLTNTYAHNHDALVCSRDRSEKCCLELTELLTKKCDEIQELMHAICEIAKSRQYSNNINLK